MAEREPSARTIAVEIAVFAAVIALVGLGFACLREVKDGPRVWSAHPHEDAPTGR